MSRPQVILDPAVPRVVGSFGNVKSLAEACPETVAKACDIVEIRLDLLEAEGVLTATRPWAHLIGLPLLFTARRGNEGGAGDLTAAQRSALLEAVLDEASLIDVELMSAREMSVLLEKAKARNIPWVASWHDFEGRQDSFDLIPQMAKQAANSGAACFKAAVRLHEIEDVAKLTELLTEVELVPLSLMGMGPLAPVSRLLCAQFGSVLNYGYLGDAPTAPGQWTAELLRSAVRASEIGLR
jgi:3-dehydroquinate dehydratase-1